MVAPSDWKGMKNRVTYALAFLLLTSLALTAPSSALGGAQGPTEEKNINIRIPGDEDSEGYILVGDEEKVKTIKEGESCAFMGINMEELTDEIIEKFGYPKDSGILVTNIVDDSAAEKFGLVKHDIIYSFDGKKVSSPKELAEMVREKKPGEMVNIVYYRDGKKKNMEMELGERTYDVLSMDWEKYGDAMKMYAKSAALVGQKAFRIGRDWHIQRGKLGLVIKDLNDDLADYFDVKPGEGVLVIEVLEESPAEEAGIKAGDVVVKISGEDVSGVDEFLDEVYECTGKDEVGIVIVRKGKKKEIVLDVSKELHKVMFMPDHKIKRIEITEEPEYEIFRDKAMQEVYEKKALEEEIKNLQKELERLKKRLDKIEKE